MILKQTLYILMLFLFIISCKKNKEIDLSNTNWNTKFRLDDFTFFAEKELQLKGNNTCLDIGRVDTTSGSWTFSGNKLKIKLQDNTEIEASLISQDSLSGFRRNNSVTGLWIATRK